MANDRQFIVEVLDAQGGLIRRLGGDKVIITGSRVTGATSGGAASLSTNAGAGQSATVAAAVGTSPSVKILDSASVPVASSTVSWVVNGGGGSIAAAIVNTTTNASGIATLSSLWTLGTTAGANILEAYSGALTNSPISFTATGVASSAFSIQVSGGTSQTTTPTGTMASRMTVLVNDAFTNVPAATAITWTTTDGSGSFVDGSITTTSSGVASNLYVAHQSASTASITASIPSGVSARLGMGVVAGPAISIDIVAGNNQTALSGATLAALCEVSVDDGFGNAIGSGNTIQYVVVSGGGNISRTTQTPINSRGSVEWQMGAPGLDTLDAILLPVSPCRNAGVVLVGYNDDYVSSAPDVGALEHDP